MPVIRAKDKDDCGSCQIQKGVPTLNGRAYYASRKGAQMLVVERRIGQRIRINGEIEIVMLQADNGEVRLGIDSVSDRAS
jgi:hypothetical protein